VNDPASSVSPLELVSQTLRSGRGPPARSFHSDTRSIPTSARTIGTSADWLLRIVTAPSTRYSNRSPRFWPCADACMPANRSSTIARSIGAVTGDAAGGGGAEASPPPIPPETPPLTPPLTRIGALLDADTSARGEVPVTVTVSATFPICIIASWITEVPSIDTFSSLNCLKPPRVSSIRYRPAVSPPKAYRPWVSLTVVQRWPLRSTAVTVTPGITPPC
jgi:hypothetical protein